MSEVFPTIDGWVGYGGGKEALLRSHESWDSGHQLVQERPDLFTAPESAPEPVPAPRKAASSTTKSKPKAGTTDA